MKRLFVFVPAILLVLFLLNSFVLKEKQAGEKTTEGTKSFTGVTLCDKSLIDSVKVPVAKANRKSELINIVFKSTDGGQTWQDISGGLPEFEKPVNRVESEGVLVATGQKGIMRSTDNGEHWQWVISEGGVGIAIERIEDGFAAISYNTQTKSRRIHISLDSGKTWKVISDGLRPSWAISSIKQMGKYLICGHPDGIFRSSDMGKTWSRVHSSVDKVDKNEFEFATLNSSSSEPRKVFRIYVSGNVVYAVAVSAGC